MKPVFVRPVIMPNLPVGGFRSTPAEVGSTCPSYPLRSPRPLEHPQRMLGTTEIGSEPMEPGNGASLGTEYPLARPFGRPAEEA